MINNKVGIDNKHVYWIINNLIDNNQGHFFEEKVCFYQILFFYDRNFGLMSKFGF